MSNKTLPSFKWVFSLKEELDSFLPMKKENRKALDSRLFIEFNCNSMAIDGHLFSYEQTTCILSDNEIPKGISLKDAELMKAHQRAINYACETFADENQGISEEFIKKLHQMVSVRSSWEPSLTPEGDTKKKKLLVGEYKKTSNSFKFLDGSIHTFTSPEKTPSEMNQLIKWYNENPDKLDPWELAVIFHSKIMLIQPFDSHNGIIARILMNYILMKHGYPTVIIKSSQKISYFNAIISYLYGDKKPIFEFISTQHVWSLELAIRAAKGMNIQNITPVSAENNFLEQGTKEKSNIYANPYVALGTLNHIYDKFFDKIKKKIKTFYSFFEEVIERRFIEEDEITKEMIESKSFLKRFDGIIPSDVSYIFNFKNLKSTHKKVDIITKCTLFYHEDFYIIEVFSKGSQDTSAPMKIRCRFNYDDRNTKDKLKENAKNAIDQLSAVIKSY